MPTYILNVEGHKTIIGELDSEVLIQLYRQPHDLETEDNRDNPRFLGPGNWSGSSRDRAATQPIPEVYRVFPDQTTPLYDWAIRLIRDMNPDFTIEQVMDILDNRWALANGTGWPGRRNILTGADLTKGFPNYHAALIFGGMLLKGREVNGNLEIENIRYDEPVTAQYVLERPWLWGYATAVTSTGRVNMITKPYRLDTTRRIPIRVPFITKEPVSLPLKNLHKLEPGYVPNVPHQNVNKFALANGKVEGEL